MRNDWIFEQYVKEITKTPVKFEEMDEEERRRQTRERLIQRGSCCGKTCEQCPYDPPFVYGNKVLRTSP